MEPHRGPRPAAVTMDAAAPRRLSLRTRLVLAGFAAAGIPVAILLGVYAVVGVPDTPTAIVAGLGAWLSAGFVLAIVARVADGANAMRATLEQQVVLRTAELSEARDRAEREARLKGVFLAAMSHEIRTPMNSIVGMAELMAETPLDGEQREYCDTIRTSTDALLGVINDILDFSRFEAQGVSLEAIDFDLRLVVEDAVDLLAVKASTTGLDLAAVVEPGFDGRFRGDPSRLRQVLVNLLGNAIKFTARGSVVARVTGLPGDADAAGVRIEVTDTGIGMTPEGLARLFRPFAQAEAPISRNRGGTGLGLAISRRLAELMDGDLTLASELGQGTTVTLSLELEIVSGAEADASAESALELPVPIGVPRPRERRRILVVDDNEFNRAVLARQVAALGYEAEQASDGEEALQLVEQGDYALILADCQMPGMDGFEFARAVRAAEASEGRARIPIVAWTANVMPDDVAACRDAGMDDVLAKPSALPTVQRVLRTWVDHAGETVRVASPGGPAPPPATDGAPIDRMQLRAIMDGDPALEAEMLAGFRTASVKEAAVLREALVRRDCNAIRHASHRMKGLARLVAASSLASVCEQLERQARAGCVDDPALALAEFEREWHRVSDFLNAAIPT